MLPVVSLTPQTTTGSSSPGLAFAGLELEDRRRSTPFGFALAVDAPPSVNMRDERRRAFPFASWLLPDPNPNVSTSGESMRPGGSLGRSLRLTNAPCTRCKESQMACKMRIEHERTRGEVR